MRILHVIRTLDPAWGGPVEVIRNLVAAGRSVDASSEVVCLDEKNSPWLGSWDVPVAALGPALLQFGYTRKLDEWLDTNVKRFDAIVVHSIWMYFSFATWKAATRHEVPYYLYAHGALDPWFKRKYPAKHLRKSLYWKLFEHKVMRDAAAVLFASEEEKLLAENAFQPYVCHSEVVGCGTAFPVEAQRGIDKGAVIGTLSESYPRLAGRNYLLYLGRIHEKKGLDLLLAAFSEVRGLYAEVALLIAGPGDPALLKRLRSMAERLRISDRIVWTGPLYGETKWLAIKAADAFVLSSHQENFGISVTEALACGTPVLISDKVNIWREIGREAAGLIETDTVSGTARLLRRWHDLPPDERLEMSRQAKSCFRKHFDISRVQFRLFDLLRSRRTSTMHAETYSN